jgi:hypothetical protein
MLLESTVRSLYWLWFKVEQDMQYTYNITMKHILAAVVAMERQYILRYQCVFVALGICDALHMRHIVIS